MATPRDAERLQRRRFEALALYRQGLSQADISRRLDVTRQSVSRWIKASHRRGERGLHRKARPGRPAKLTATQQRQLVRKLAAGAQRAGYETQLWTAERIRELIRDKFEVDFHVHHVPKLLRQLGWSCQRPTGRARERDEAAVRRWLQTDWPRIKKKPSSKMRS